ncbi:family 10 glycosylhydrolase [Lusitaniella coriacea LEGE 07157]|uniref:Family 10 glycosylhydrolase n=1 Tax=Lusitaniella coriacea LEGE 07157 TaxID=945747 RepID=A0A8J7J6Z4_9CYAN|nr:family 10 glycosylhydrolase [Lusitaniella coriacea]MBE9119089.1 family 10 glycosylhydrolase [Lusitaniella coriacea LEGE 07157]
MPQSKKKPKGCGCSSIPLSVIFLLFGSGYFLFAQRNNLNLGQWLPSELANNIPFLEVSSPEPVPSPEMTIQPASPLPQASIVAPTPSPSATVVASPAIAPKPNSWQTKTIRGIYISRYQITNNASEEAIRANVRYYREKGFNTIIHGVFGNACPMYESKVMQQTFGSKSCPNEFEEEWLTWLIDEAHKQGMQVHAYFEKGIKIDKNSPIFDRAIERGWLVAGVDRTHPGVEHYVLDVGVPEVANFYTNILVEFVQKYPTVDAVQWDDYLGYYAELPGNVDRTPKLTQFVKGAIAAMKKANPAVSFDLCHHNPYWAKRYFAADWANWGIDRAFIQVYSEANFKEEMKYIKEIDGIAISERQLNRLGDLAENPQIKGILLFPLSGKPKELAAQVHELMD